MWKNILLARVERSAPETFTTSFGIRFRRVTKPLLRPILRLAARRRIHIEGYPNLQKDVPYIFASTHSFVDDVIVNYACVDRSAYMLVGTPDQVEHNPAMYAAWLNGMVFVDKLDPQSRKDSVEKMVRVLESGSSVILYPEGAWNNTENLLVQPLFAGPWLLAQRTGCRVVPIAIYRDVRGLRWRRVCHLLVLALLRCSGFFAGQRLTILGDRRGAVSGPCVYACTHVGRYDIEMALRIIGRQCWFFMGDPGRSYRDLDGLVLRMNGTIFTDTAFKEDRRIGKETCIHTLERGGSVLIFPEGAWNITENLVVQPLFPGAAEMALRTGAKIVPIAIEQYGKRYCANIGEPIDPRAYRQAPCEAGAGTAGMPGREEKQRLTDHLRDVLCTLRWEIWAQAAPAARADLSETAAEYLEGIMRESEKGYTVEEILRTRFHPKEASPAEAFAFLQKLKPCRENAFLLRGREAYLRREPPQ